MVWISKMRGGGNETGVQINSLVELREEKINA